MQKYKIPSQSGNRVKKKKRRKRARWERVADAAQAYEYASQIWYWTEGNG